MMLRRIIVLTLLLAVCLAASAQQIRIGTSASSDFVQGSFCWNSLPSAAQYGVYRQFPDQDTFALIALQADTCFTDLPSRHLCDDTVRYYVAARLSLPDTVVVSDTVALPYRDLQPTAACRLLLATVDSLSQRVLLSWHPSPDPDVMGYYLCKGAPCTDYDTVWGRLDTTYLCLEEDPAQQHDFRILAFDSCFRASPLTPYYHNLALRLEAEACDRKVTLSWNRYISMPDSVGRYVLCYGYNSDPDTAQQIPVAAVGPYTHTLRIPDSVRSMQCVLRAVNTTGTLCAESARLTHTFSTADTARFLTIDSVVYDDLEPSATLLLSVDSLFDADGYQLYRSQHDGAMRPLAWLPHTGQGRLQYVDRTFSRMDSVLAYTASVTDACRRNPKYSAVHTFLLPEVIPAGAFFPNAIVAGDPDRGTFCPAYLSPLADGYSLTIYSRMGVRVFATQDISQCWTGLSADGRPLPQGVYVYLARCRHADGTVKNYSGTVFLIR